MRASFTKQPSARTNCKLMLSDLEPLSSSLTSPPSSSRYLSSHRLYTSLALASATVSRPLLTIPCNFTKLPNFSSLLIVCKEVSHSKNQKFFINTKTKIPHLLPASDDMYLRNANWVLFS